LISSEDMIKFLVLVCLAAVALAEPEAEAGGWGGYKSYKHHARAYHARPLPARKPYRAPPPPPAPRKAYHVEHHSHPICKTVYEVATAQECKVVQEKECTTVPETKVRTEYHEHCHTVTEKQCKPTVRQVPDKECATTYVDECHNEAHTITETGYVDECQDIQTQVCEETSIVGHHRSEAYKTGEVVGPAVVSGPVVRTPAAVPAVPVPVPAVPAPAVVAKKAGHYPKPVAATPWKVPAAWQKRHKREAKAEAEPGYAAPAPAPYHAPAPGPKCQAKVDRVCKKVPVQNQKVVEHPKCHKVPQTHCHDIVRTVPDEVCHDVPRHHCEKVAEKIPYDVPKQVCKDVDVPVCRDVTSKVPRQVCKEVHSAHITHGYDYGHH